MHLNHRGEVSILEVTEEEATIEVEAGVTIRHLRMLFLMLPVHRHKLVQVLLLMYSNLLLQ
jgi:hypothetical protein